MTVRKKNTRKRREHVSGTNRKVKRVMRPGEEKANRKILFIFKIVLLLYYMEINF